jgi:hypothetical protein
VIYLYAYTNHKENLDSLRRVVALYKTLKEQNLESEILINDYRAQLLLKDWGYPLATTIETIKDIDAVATPEDLVVIDSPEKIEGKVLDYPNKFKAIIYINSLCKEVKFDNATIINTFLDNNLIFSKEKEQTRDKKAIYIYGDSDYNKTILKNSEIFKNKELDLYWGIYFFVKYEDDLAKIFNNIIESEEYYDILIQYQKIITSSIQIAIEARANGAFVEFLELDSLKECYVDILNKNDIKITKEINNTNNILLPIKNLNNYNNKIINIIKSYV